MTAWLKDFQEAASFSTAPQRGCIEPKQAKPYADSHFILASGWHFLDSLTKIMKAEGRTLNGSSSRLHLRDTRQRKRHLMVAYSGVQI